MKDVRSDEFQNDVLDAGIPVLVKFYSPDCSPCRAMLPVIYAVADSRAGSLKVVKFDATQDVAFAASLEIRSVPAFLLFRSGKRIGQLSGAVGRKKLDGWIDEMLEQ